jgi:hypothetical protein
MEERVFNNCNLQLLSPCTCVFYNRFVFILEEKMLQRDPKEGVKIGYIKNLKCIHIILVPQNILFFDIEPL